MLPITCEVPEGSVPGPLFLIHANDLPNVSKLLRFYLFADDTGIYFDSENLLTLQKIVKRELRKVRKWLEANRLALNISRTNYVIFTPLQKKKLNEFIRINLGSKVINRVQYTKYLGILLDSTLRWNLKLLNYQKKLARTTGIFYKIRHYGLKKSSFRSKSGQKFCRNQSKSIKFVTSCAGHVDGIKK